MGNRAAVAWLLAALFVGALIAGLVSVHANDISCGSALAGGVDTTDLAVAEYQAALEGGGVTDLQAACDDRVSTQRLIVFPVLAIAALGGGFLLLTARKREEDQTPRAV